ncbi:Protein CBG03498 [Caenorhabditis briggsae]|uniref:Protein CBG03498 n=1 Tax=Caenorhabditis briggsae TaxID=6238 RepID=A8WV95_CAEBR|nr:Protein CBG03498 [Caenorhabditis briggsae]CAP24406.2 Protein CBG03498 [Caenorhabditis briggsae]
MLVVGAKNTFVMKHVFNDVASMEVGKAYYGPEEEHFGVSWRICMIRCPLRGYSLLECLKPRETNPWKIETKISSNILKPNGNWRTSFISHDFSQKSLENATFYDCERTSRYVIDGTMTIKLEVEIQKMSGFESQILRKFDDVAAKELSDVVLVAGSQEFHVNKMYLSLHSLYF